MRVLLVDAELLSEVVKNVPLIGALFFRVPKTEEIIKEEQKAELRRLDAEERERE